MPYGTGRSAPAAYEIMDLMRYRRRQLQALAHRAERHDEVERELRELDRDIAAGIAELERRDALQRAEIHAALERRIRISGAPP